MVGASVDAGSGTLDHDGHPERMFGLGVLHVEIYRARMIRGDEFIGMGKADPYLKVKHGSTLMPVTLKSEPHQDGGSDPTWGAQFEFPILTGGCKDHNILDIEIWNRNGGLRRDNILGHLRIGRLADWITRQTNSITERAWYPVFTRADKKITRQERQAGEILMKFYYQNVEVGTFQHGFHSVPRYVKMQVDSGHTWSDHSGRVQYQLEEGSRLSPVLGRVGRAIGIAQSLIIVLGML